MRVLKDVGAWDPYNVTEDADLGIRLARFGYRTATILSRTFEEAPISRRQWLAQRRRWLKGWMQTLLVVFRPAGANVPALKPADKLSVLAILGTGVAGLLIFPLVLFGFAVLFLVHGGVPAPETLVARTLLVFALFNGALLLLLSGVTALRGLLAIGRLDLAPLIVLLPFYWLAMSFAGWQALAQLLRQPFLWEKTDHGLSRRRRTPAAPRAPSGHAGPPLPARRRSLATLLHASRLLRGSAERC
ncbi:glycosyltransferase family 2 protein [Afifella pfennigii]|uniref:glycosyltransferase family 2 protein n=1 Tax=Afifella pfennigii TaxID=209897 RepID=UPI00068D1489|nr:glycosyltransferase family 2 protein [Afifella pfennigii]